MPANAAAGADEVGQRDKETARAAIDTMNRAAPQSAPPEPSTGQLTWQDHALRFVGTLVDNADNPSIRAKAFDLRTNKQIGSYELPVVPDLSLAPAMVIFMVTFNIPGDSTTPQPHIHISYLYFRIQSDNSAVLVQNCDQTGGCYPAQGRVALE